MPSAYVTMSFAQRSVQRFVASPPAATASASRTFEQSAPPLPCKLLCVKHACASATIWFTSGATQLSKSCFVDATMPCALSFPAYTCFATAELTQNAEFQSNSSMLPGRFNCCRHASRAEQFPSSYETCKAVAPPNRGTSFNQTTPTKVWQATCLHRRHCLICGAQVCSSAPHQLSALKPGITSGLWVGSSTCATKCHAWY
mmetsp:Transcript_46585/g.79387  ORF Transcript_46585/g.79387 Transcript_46585/m.79387 type:complete len:201 (-) Transcript_46585:465-1067(-)